MFINHKNMLQPRREYEPVATIGPFWAAISRYLDRRDREALSEAVSRSRGEWSDPEPDPPQPIQHRKKGGWKNRR